MNSKEQNRKRKESYLRERKKRFKLEISRYMEKNEIETVVAFSTGFGFSDRYIHDLIGKQLRGIPEWILSHMSVVDDIKSKESGEDYYCFNTNYVTTGFIHPRSLRVEKKKHEKAMNEKEAEIQELKRQMLILQGKYEEATRKRETI